MTGVVSLKINKNKKNQNARLKVVSYQDIYFIVYICVSSTY